MEPFSDAAVEAVGLYLRRQARLCHPTGKFDRAGRFSLAEKCSHTIRIPSRRYPYSEMLHGRTLEHAIDLTGVDPTETRRLARLVRA